MYQIFSHIVTVHRTRESVVVMISIICQSS